MKQPLICYFTPSKNLLHDLLLNQNQEATLLLLQNHYQKNQLFDYLHDSLFLVNFNCLFLYLFNKFPMVSLKFDYSIIMVIKSHYFRLKECLQAPQILFQPVIQISYMLSHQIASHQYFSYQKNSCQQYLQLNLKTISQKFYAPCYVLTNRLQHAQLCLIMFFFNLYLHLMPVFFIAFHIINQLILKIYLVVSYKLKFIFIMCHSFG